MKLTISIPFKNIDDLDNGLYMAGDLRLKTSTLLAAYSSMIDVNCDSSEFPMMLNIQIKNPSNIRSIESILESNTNYKSKLHKLSRLLEKDEVFDLDVDSDTDLNPKTTNKMIVPMSWADV